MCRRRALVLDWHFECLPSICIIYMYVFKSGIFIVWPPNDSISILQLKKVEAITSVIFFFDHGGDSFFKFLAF